jgi:hypothetical protein
MPIIYWRRYRRPVFRVDYTEACQPGEPSIGRTDGQGRAVAAAWHGRPVTVRELRALVDRPDVQVVAIHSWRPPMGPAFWQAVISDREGR